MRMSFGKYKDKPVGWVLIEDVKYFQWMGSQGMDNRKEYLNFVKLVQILDSKPFIKTCTGDCNPKNTATCFSIYTTNPSPYYYCDNCNPYNSGAMRGRLSFGRTIADAIRISSDPNCTVRSIAMAKGAPARKTEAALLKFFGL